MPCRSFKTWLLMGSMVSMGACVAPPSLADVPGAASLRGLSRVDHSTAWVCGSAATVARSEDGGQSWQLLSPPAALADALDFRDIHAFSKSEVVLMAAGPGEKSKIFRTSDGGQSWKICAVNEHPEGFWDSFAFWDRNRGLLVGDPVEGRLSILRTVDGGVTWTPVPVAGIPAVQEGEFAFAASGTAIAVAGKKRAWIATGGRVARVFRSTDGGEHWQIVETPIAAGTAGSGIFSVAFRDALHGVLVGGDYEKPEQVLPLAAWTEDGGLHWHASARMPRGYRSGVSWHPQRQQWLAVGPNGTDVSSEGRRWTALQPSLVGFHAVAGEWMSGMQGHTAYWP